MKLTLSNQAREALAQLSDHLGLSEQEICEGLILASHESQDLETGPSETCASDGSEPSSLLEVDH